MSLSQLEHAATSPSRFANVLRHKTRPHNIIQHVANRILSQHSTLSATPNIEACFEHLSIVPGGRFLVTMSVRRPHEKFLQLWDLGFNSEMEINSQPVATAPLGKGRIHYKPETQVAPDGQGLLVAVSEMWPVSFNRSRRYASQSSFCSRCCC
jgi:hypothetical protein